MNNPIPDSIIGSYSTVRYARSSYRQKIEALADKYRAMWG